MEGLHAPPPLRETSGLRPWIHKTRTRMDSTSVDRIRSVSEAAGNEEARTSLVALQVGVVGCGHISKTHLRGWERVAGARVAGVLDLDTALARGLAERFNVPTVFADLDQLLDRCDIVDVCTPPRAHADAVVAAASTGRHVLVEKPFVVTVDEWKRARGVIEASGIKVSAVHNLKYSLAMLNAQRWIRAGRIGEVLRVDRLFLTSPSKDRMFDPCGHWSHALPGGRWFETLPHELYTVYDLIGPARLEGVSVVATVKAPPGAPAEEVTVTLSTKRTIATLHYSANCELNRRQTRIYGTEGMIHIDGPSDSAYLSRAGSERWKRPIGGPFIESGAILKRFVSDRGAYALKRAKRQTAHERVIRAFVEHIAGRGPAPGGIDEIDYVVRNSHLIGQAIDRGVVDVAGRAGPGEIW